ncbi:MAG: serine/threonine-protein kinase [Jatrophihabitantaceae bacterium]
MARARSDALAGNPFDGFTDVLALHTGLNSGVFQATEEMTGRPVALKVLSVDGVTPRALDAFGRESAVLAALSAHPNIVTLFRSFALPDRRPVLVLELCPGSIEERLRGTMPFTPKESVSTAIKIAGALETAHRGGVLHRDVRPANILVTDFGEPALSDFGVARLRSSISAPAELFDFPSVHVAPELLMGQEASEATDVYGLASTLYEMLAGQPALAAYVGESPAATILRILRDPARGIFGDDVPLELSDLVLWGLQKEPAARPPSVMWFAEELGRIEHGNSWLRTRNLVRDPDGQVQAPKRRRSTAPRPSVVRRSAALDATVTPDERIGPADDKTAGPDENTEPRTLTALPEQPADVVLPVAGAASSAAVAAPPAPQWTPPAARTDSTSTPAPAELRRRIVLRAPLLSAAGTLLAIAGPLWAVAVAALAITRPATAVVLWTVAGAAVLTLLASRFARPTLVLEGCHMRHRDGLARVLIPWAAVVAVKSQYEPSRRPGAPHGLIVAVGTHATLPLAATRRSAWELADLIALLEVFRAADATHPHH